MVLLIYGNADGRDLILHDLAHAVSHLRGEVRTDRIETSRVIRESLEITSDFGRLAYPVLADLWFHHREIAFAVFPGDEMLVDYVNEMLFVPMKTLQHSWRVLLIGWNEEFPIPETLADRVQMLRWDTVPQQIAWLLEPTTRTAVS